MNALCRTIVVLCSSTRAKDSLNRKQIYIRIIQLCQQASTNSAVLAQYEIPHHGISCLVTNDIPAGWEARQSSPSLLGFANKGSERQTEALNFYPF
jgi:hypothetical protein